MKLVRTTALLASIAVGAALAGTVRATADPGVDWAPCAENGDVQCATVTVPVDWARPSGETIEVAVVRRAAAHPKGTLFMMPGGPGGSGVDQLRAPDGVPPELAGEFDVVSFDPRGTNRSHPVRCDGDLAANPPETSPDAGATFASVAAYSKADDHASERTGEVLVVTQAAQLPVPTARDQVGAFRTSSLTSPAVRAKPVSDSSTAAPKITPIT